MPFADREGTTWLAYIEGIASTDNHGLVTARLPGRRLRFDSETESRVTNELPAGAPFLSDERLQALLDRAQLCSAPGTATWQLPEPAVRLRRVMEWTARAGEAGVALLVELARRWREGAGRRRELRHQAAELMAGGIDKARRLAAKVKQEIEDEHRGSPPPPAEPTAPRSVVARRWRGARSARRAGPR